MRRTAGHRVRRRASAGSLAVVAVLVVLVGCASGPIATSDGTAIPTWGTAGALSAVTGDRLASSVTYSEGQERFDPPPAAYHPKITAKQAFDAFAKEVDPRSLGTDEQPTVLLASYTNFITGKHATFVTGTMDPVAAAKSDEASKPWWVGVPVWYIRYLRVPTMPVGAPAAPDRTAVPPKVVVQEMVIPVSADTGQVLMMENTTADRTPTSWPPPPGNGDTRKSADRPGG